MIPRIPLVIAISLLTTASSAFGAEFDLLTMKRLSKLEYETRIKISQLLREARKKWPQHKIVLAETWRSCKRQRQLHKKGPHTTRAKPGYSWHNWGRAADIYFTKAGKILPYHRAPYQELGEMAELWDIEWGGRWKTPFDPGHFEYHPDLTLKDMLNNPKEVKKWLR